jgi:hypothetical protein
MSRAAEPQLTKFYSKWSTLSEQQKLRLLPRLLHETREWENWASDEQMFLAWLRWKFEQANMPFPPRR